MARVVLGPMISDARGKVGGTVFSRNAAGHYTRAKVSPVQPRTNAQIKIRVGMCNMAQYWRDTMTAPLRAVWEQYAQATPLTDRFGAKAVISGLAMFLRCNAILKAVALTPITAGPTTPGEAAMQKATFTGTDVNGVIITAPDPVLTAGDFFIVLMSPAPMSQARNYYSGPFTLWGVQTSTDVFPKTIVEPPQTALGQRWFFQLRRIEKSGKVSPTTLFRVDILT